MSSLLRKRFAASALVALTFLLPSCRQETPLWQSHPLGSSADFRDVFFADASHGWIAGGAYNVAGGMIGRTADGGKTWQFTSGIVSTHAMSNGTHVTALHFFDATRGIAATDRGMLYLTSDAGENWGEVRRWSASRYIWDLAFLDDQNGWASGPAGLLRTTDGGETWGAWPRENEAGERIEGRSIAFRDRDNGWLVGQHAHAMTTSDGGKTWSRVEMPLTSGERIDFWDVHFVDENRGWIVGDEGTLLHTSDAGATWSLRPLGIAGVRSAPKLERIQRGNKVETIDAGDRSPGLTLASIDFADPMNGWIAGFFSNMGRSLILRTADGGKTWSVEADIDGEELRSLFALDRDHVWAIGARTRPGAQAIFYRSPDASAK